MAREQGARAAPPVLGEDLVREQQEHCRRGDRVGPQPVEARQDGGQFVAAVQGQEDFFDGREGQFGPVVERLAHKFLCFREL